MTPRTVKLIYPHKSLNDNLIKISVSKVPFSKTDTIYDTVDFFRLNIFPKIKTNNEQVEDKVQLREIINLHNNTGIRDVSQIISMVQQIKCGREVISLDGMPNIKLVKTKSNEKVLFDGHHSLLAYMVTGRKYLNEVPHLIVENESGYVSDKEILVFFGAHSKKLKDSNWREYVINWQAPKEKQLCKRIQKNIGELLDSILVLMQGKPCKKITHS